MTILPILLGCVLAGSIRTQDEATTIFRLVEEAEAIAVVRAVTATDPAADVRRWRFLVEERLRGDLAGYLDLSEPNYRTCGSALHGLVPGMRFVVFLRNAPQAPELVASSARCMPRASAQLIAHVRYLAQTKDEVEQLNALGAALTSNHKRLRRDAALTLPQLPRLEKLEEAYRVTLLRSLASALSERDATATALATAATRLHLDDALDFLVPAYFDGRYQDLGPWFLAVVPGFDHERAARTIEPDADAQRAVRLLSRLSSGTARRLLLKHAGGPHRAAAERAARTLLQRGLSPLDLRDHIAPGLLEAARTATDPTPRFRYMLRR